MQILALVLVLVPSFTLQTTVLPITEYRSIAGRLIQLQFATTSLAHFNALFVGWLRCPFLTEIVVMRARKAPKRSVHKGVQFPTPRLPDNQSDRCEMRTRNRHSTEAWFLGKCHLSSCLLHMVPFSRDITCVYTCHPSRVRRRLSQTHYKYLLDKVR